MLLTFSLKIWLTVPSSGGSAHDVIKNFQSVHVLLTALR